MPMYKVTFIYNFAEHGWTETFYRPSGDARTATNFGGGPGLLPWLAIRPAEARLAAIRAQEVNGLRRVYLRLTNYPGTSTLSPEVTSISTRLWVPFEGRSGRSLWIRGLVDDDVKRDFRGMDQPSPTLRQAIRFMGERFHDFDLCGRRIVQQFPWVPVAEFGKHPDSNQLTLVRLKQDYPFVAGQYVYFGGPKVLGMRTEQAYLVWDYGDKYLEIINPWPEGLAVQSPQRPFRVRTLEYEYPPLTEPRFAQFTKFRTSTNYHPATWLADSPRRIPFSPCGRIVDFLRKGYRTEIRPFADDPGLTVPIVWYFPSATEPARKAVPYEHPFASRTWDLGSDYPTILGEVYERSWYSGREPADVKGIGLCGARRQWERGALAGDPTRPLNPDTGQPCCCGPGSLFLEGGAAASGAVPNSLGPVVVWKGGAAAGPRVVATQLEGGAAAGPRVVATQLEGGAAAFGKVYHDPGDRVEDCDSCPDGAWTQYRVLIEGGTGEAEHWNGDWVVTHSGFCFWGFEDPETGNDFSLVFVADGEDIGVVVNLVGGASAAYSITGSANCDGPWTLIRQGGGGQGHPETIFVEHYE